jgi:colanic acid/amylovoran biosynthesis glycosyltransferase
MKIALIVKSFPSLSETFILSQIVGVIEQGFDVDIYALEAGDLGKVHPSIEKYNLLGRTYYQPSLPKDYVFRVVKAFFIFLRYLFAKPLALLRCLNFFVYGRQAFSLRLFYAVIPFIKNRDKSYQILHCHFADIGLKGVYVREVIGLSAKMLTTFHGYDLTAIPNQSKGNPYQLLFEKGDFFTAGSSFMIKLATSLGCPECRLVKLPMGIDTSSYKFEAKVLKSDEDLKILTVARLVEKKGIEYSIRAVSEVIERYPNVSYRIAGDGPLRENLNSIIEDLGISDKVELLGWKTKDEVRDLYADSHIFLLTSVTASNGDKEGQGLVLQEAQAMGLPVLATTHNGFPDSIKDGVSGFLVPERDTDSLKEKLFYLIENSESWEEMGCAGRSFVEEVFDSKKLTQKLINIYHLVLTDL